MARVTLPPENDLEEDKHVVIVENLGDEEELIIREEMSHEPKPSILKKKSAEKKVSITYQDSGVKQRVVETQQYSVSEIGYRPNLKASSVREGPETVEKVGEVVKRTVTEWFSERTYKLLEPGLEQLDEEDQDDEIEQISLRTKVLNIKPESEVKYIYKITIGYRYIVNPGSNWIVFSSLWTLSW